MPTKRENLQYIAGWFEMAGSIPRRDRNATAILIANNPRRREGLEIAHSTLGGTIEEFGTANGKTMYGLFLDNDEAVKALKAILPFLRTLDWKAKVERAINSLEV